MAHSGTGSGGGPVSGSPPGRSGPLAARARAAYAVLEEHAEAASGTEPAELRALAEELLEILRQAVATPGVSEVCVDALAEAAEVLQPLRDGIDPPPGGAADLAEEVLAPLARALRALETGQAR